MTKYEIQFTSAYKKSRKKMKKRGLDLTLLDEVVLKLANGVELDKKYRDHELLGSFKGFRECHIKPDWLLIYLLKEELLVLTLVDTGTHSELFNM